MELRDIQASALIKTEPEDIKMVIKEEPCLETKDCLYSTGSMQSENKDWDTTLDSNELEVSSSEEGQEANEDDIEMIIKEEPPLDIDDYHSNSDLESSESYRNAISRSAVGPSSGKNKYKPRVNARCNVCLKIFTATRSLQKHFKSQHPGVEFEPDYKCKSCDTFFKTLKDMRLHLEVTHTSKNLDKRESMQCNVCKKIFSTISNLRKHVKTFHESSPRPEAEYKCLTNSWINTKNLDKHENARCNVCKKIFSTRGNLSKHFKISHSSGVKLEPDFKCFKCDIFFKTLEDVNQHSKDAHPSQSASKVKLRDQVQIQCNVCNQVYKRFNYLKVHFLKAHPGQELEAQYQCGKCKLFFNKKDYKEH